MQILVLFKGFWNKFTEIVSDVKLFTLLLTEMLLQHREVTRCRRTRVFNKTQSLKYEKTFHIPYCKIGKAVNFF